MSMFLKSVIKEKLDVIKNNLNVEYIPILNDLIKCYISEIEEKNEIINILEKHILKQKELFEKTIEKLGAL